MAHWYDRKGNAKYEINKVGSSEKRATTLTDARKFLYVPSVTTITGILAKPMVDKWKLDILLDLIWNSPVDLTYDNYKQIILSKAKIKWEESAKRGTEIHDKLEDYFLHGKIDTTDEKFIVPALNLLAHEFNGQKWVSEQGFAHKSGFGGKVDLYSKGKNKRGIILDFKTKAKAVLDKNVLYDDYCMQLAAYRAGLDLPDAECYNLFISTTSPGTLMLHKWEEEDLKLGLRKFNLLLEFWKLAHNYDSSFEEEVE